MNDQFPDDRSGFPAGFTNGAGPAMSVVLYGLDARIARLTADLAEARKPMRAQVKREGEDWRWTCDCGITNWTPTHYGAVRIARMHVAVHREVGR